MQLSVKGKQLDVGDAMRTHIEDSLSRTLDKYFGDAIEVNVTLTREAHLYQATVSAHVGRNIRLQANGAAAEPYPAFDVAAERLSKRLRRHKRKLRDHGNSNERAVETQLAQQYILSGDAESLDGEGDEGDSKSLIVAEMATDIPSLTAGQAVMRMDLEDLPAMMFRNSSHGGLNMIYRRPDGNIGWIDPRGNRGE
ncbi:ribosome-associated translation inhibitor RaiA [Pelagibius sp. Alg239-R121]|uniref:ribosome hibernation-promoting factor, HPF/YfiA family n=1 Tax=Pelagibius sp. Alg239-R121 TaxID=2993448 RepID=UPI0024A60F59|nr:ribosome-associated translation inhibitor RaiA [Pelagibius sp. Alg239-R121]